ncbi:MAG TPA: hypothetical protein VEA69_13955 [Tepidisphaeraceae bacterium]|nr:hypothetical protein [Tepidisphaeraceae bacterium]
MSTLEITLPDDLKRRAEEQAAAGRYATVSEYVAALIASDPLGGALEAHLVSRVKSGPPTPMTDSDFGTIRSRLEGAIAGRTGSAIPTS